MGLLIPLLAILGSFGIPLYALKIYGDGRRHKRDLEARKLLPAGGGEDVKRLTEENKLLRERVENLESIVCSVDFELNQKLAKVIDEQRSLLLPAMGQTANGGGSGSSPGSGAGSSPAVSPAGGSAGSSNRLTAVRDTPAAPVVAFDRTATAAAVRAQPIT